MKMQNKTKENDVNTLVKYDMPWPCLNILPNCDHTKIMCPNCAHQTGMLYDVWEKKEKYQFLHLGLYV